MLKGYKWGVAVLLGVFGVAWAASYWGWGVSEESQAGAQAQSLARTPSIRGTTGSRWFSGGSGGGYRSGK